MYFGYHSFARDMFCIFFQQSVVCLFIFKNLLKGQTRTLMKINLSSFSLWVILVVPHLGNLRLTQGCKNFSPKFFSRNLRFLHFTFTSIVHFMLIYGCSTRYELNWVFVLFRFFLIDVQQLLQYLLKIPSFLYLTTLASLSKVN